MPAAELPAHAVLQFARDQVWTGAGYAWLYEVRNKTGASHAQYRYADALVASLYPSRGIWFAGVEVKVSRGDWLRELKDVRKSDEIQRFCDYWWIAAPEGVVKLEELPVTWGLLEVRGKKIARARAAPKIKKPAPPTLEFVASLLRNSAEGLNRIRAAEFARGREETEKRFDQSLVSELEQSLRELQRERDQLAQQLQWKERSLAELRRDIQEFERSSGVEGIGRFHPVHNLGRYFRLAQQLSTMPDVELRLRTALAAFEPLAEIVKGLES